MQIRKKYVKCEIELCAKPKSMYTLCTSEQHVFKMRAYNVMNNGFKLFLYTWFHTQAICNNINSYLDPHITCYLGVF